MPKISRTCRTPGCLQENEPVITGMRECIHCGRTMAVPDPEKKPTPALVMGDLTGLSSWYLVELDES